MLKRWLRKLEILECNYGRNCVWQVELNGQILCRLDDCNVCEMFWCSYRVVPADFDVEETVKILAMTHDEDRPEFEALVFRNLDFDSRFRDGAWRSGVWVNTEEFAQTGRVSARWLYLNVICWPWDSFALWLRRRHKRQQAH